jgi:ribosomal protein S18 acetylase RimI-like enzyme
METSSTYAFDRFYIHHIGVMPRSSRARAVGAALIEAATAGGARPRHLARLALSTWAFNQQAQRFLKAQGFEYYNHRMWLQNLTCIDPVPASL